MTKPTAPSTPAPQGEIPMSEYERLKAHKDALVAQEKQELKVLRDELACERESRKQAEAALRKIRSHVLLAAFPVAKGSDEMLVSAARVYEAFEYVDAALGSIPQEPAERERGK